VVPTPQKTNFRPRVGGAYRLRDDLVLRGGYGIFTETLGKFHRVQGIGPYQLSETFFNSISGGRPLFAFPNPFPAGAGQIASQSIDGYPNQTENGAIHQFNLTVEKEYRGMGLRASYVGSRSYSLNYVLSVNKPGPSLTPFNQSRRPYPQFVNATFAEQDGKSKFDSVQFEVKRKMSGGLMFDAHWTISRNMADHLNLENPYDHRFWNQIGYTARHKAVLAARYELPWGRGRKWLSSAPRSVDFLLGGWTLDHIYFAESGTYFSPAFSGADPSNTNTFGGLPDRIGDGNLPRSERTLQRYFDASAFVAPPVGRFGNSGVNILEGPGQNLHHTGLIKLFRVTERTSFTYQVAFRNTFNHPQFNNPNNNISVPAQVARISSGGSNRNIQMRLRFDF
jgi:hypothetical protein